LHVQLYAPDTNYLMIEKIYYLSHIHKILNDKTLFGCEDEDIDEEENDILNPDDGWDLQVRGEKLVAVKKEKIDILMCTKIVNSTSHQLQSQT